MARSINHRPHGPKRASEREYNVISPTEHILDTSFTLLTDADLDRYRIQTIRMAEEYIKTHPRKPKRP